jgi:hypothetical protein
MTHDQTFLLVLESIAISGVVMIALRVWRRSKGKTSIFAQDESLEEVSLSAVSAAFPSRPTTEDFKTVLRPPWGLRLGAPIIGAVFLIYVDLGPVVESLGWAEPVHAFAAKVITGVALAYSAFMVLFVQRVVYDRHEIRCHGIDLRPQTRDLSGLRSITLHTKRPALVLTFVDQPHLYIPKFLSRRAQFISDMEAIAVQNAHPAEAERPTLRYRMGF